MIIFVLGTTAELIKVKPIINQLRRRGDHFEVWCTGHQFAELSTDSFVQEINLQPGVFKWISKGVHQSSLTKISQVPIWLVKCFYWFTRSFPKNFRLRKDRSVFIVHGDTMTTVLGAIFGRLLHCQVAHVEAGLRSNDWRNPFPEELDRVLTSYLAHLHFAPDEIAVKNLAKKRGLVINTNGNTIIDQVRAELQNSESTQVGDQVLVLLHRTELLSNLKLLDDTLTALLVISDKRHLLIVCDALSRAAFESRSVFGNLLNSPNVTITPKLSHSEFLMSLVRSNLVVTDSGGVQEESAALGLPCVIHRRTSERFDGLQEGGSAALTGLDVNELVNLINSPPPRISPSLGSVSPTTTIIDSLAENGFLRQV
jgi:UDP-N-acetylglucosamine 2-epimerase (non-hydrolysing)